MSLACTRASILCKALTRAPGNASGPMDLAPCNAAVHILQVPLLTYMQATRGYEDARAKVAQLINARSSRDIVFTANATAGINLVAQSWGRKHLAPGDEVGLFLWHPCHMGECLETSSCVSRSNVLNQQRGLVPG